MRGPEVYGLTLNYRGGPLSRDFRAGSLAAGDRAPDAPVTVDGRPCRLFDLFHGPQWTLLAFGVEAPGDRGYTVVRPGESAGRTTVVDSDGHVRDAYAAADGTFMLVRPDGYIGLVADTVEQVEAYWAMVMGTPSLRSGRRSSRR